jgi:hypothetical protein
MVLSALSAPLCFAVWGQLPQIPDCLPSAQYEPALVANPGMHVSFQCGNATPLDLTRAIGRQTRLPIGVVLGAYPRALSGVQHSYNLQNVDATQALRKAIDGAGYSLKKEGAVRVLLAADLAPRQKKALNYRFSNFPPGSQSMAMFALTLTTWIKAAMDNMGTGASIFGSTNDEQIRIPHMQSATTEEIANRVVSQGSRG